MTEPWTCDRCSADYSNKAAKYLAHLACTNPKCSCYQQGHNTRRCTTVTDKDRTEP